LKAQYRSNYAKYEIIKADEAIIKEDKDKVFKMTKAYSAIANAKDDIIKALASSKSIDTIILPLIEAKVKAYIEDPSAFNKLKIIQNSKADIKFINESTKNAETYNEVIEEEKKGSEESSEENENMIQEEEKHHNEEPQNADQVLIEDPNLREPSDQELYKALDKIPVP
jgi:hypothetical protein